MVRMARWPEDHPAPTLLSFRPQIVSGTNVTGSRAYTLQSTITRSATCSAKPADNKDCIHSLNTSKKYCPISSVWWPANAIAILHFFGEILTLSILFFFIFLFNLFSFDYFYLFFKCPFNYFYLFKNFFSFNNFYLILFFHSPFFNFNCFFLLFILIYFVIFILFGYTIFLFYENFTNSDLILKKKVSSPWRPINAIDQNS